MLELNCDLCGKTFLTNSSHPSAEELTFLNKEGKAIFKYKHSEGWYCIECWFQTRYLKEKRKNKVLKRQKEKLFLYLRSMAVELKHMGHLADYWQKEQAVWENRLTKFTEETKND